MWSCQLPWFLILLSHWLAHHRHRALYTYMSQSLHQMTCFYPRKCLLGILSYIVSMNGGSSPDPGFRATGRISQINRFPIILPQKQLTGTLGISKFTSRQSQTKHVKNIQGRGRVNGQSGKSFTPKGETQPSRRCNYRRILYWFRSYRMSSFFWMRGNILKFSNQVILPHYVTTLESISWFALLLRRALCNIYTCS